MKAEVLTPLILQITKALLPKNGPIPCHLDLICL